MLFWLIHILMILGAFFFVLFGVFVLVLSFYLADPFMFILSFLASTLIILFSAAILAGLVVRSVKALRSGERDGGGAEN